jgi:ATP-dependent Clp protease ATP-binding subunit ClpA
MIRTEVDRFRAVVAARLAERQRIGHYRDAVTVERCADQVEEIQAPLQTARSLVEGTDFKYGARELKRAIERLLVQPLSNLIASDQIRRGDRIRVSHEEGSPVLVFGREVEAAQAWEVARRAA